MIYENKTSTIFRSEWIIGKASVKAINWLVFFFTIGRLSFTIGMVRVLARILKFQIFTVETLIECLHLLIFSLHFNILRYR